MPLFTSSAGVLAKKTFIEAALSAPLRPLSRYRPRTALDSAIFVGWGCKANTARVRQLSAQTGRPFWSLEDGFIGYAGHPARRGVPLSLIRDDLGIYYDARQPSRLEQLIAEPCDDALLQRASALQERLVAEGVTKYNCYHDRELPLSWKKRLHADGRPRVLIVDQVAGDSAIAGALASEDDFLRMVATARVTYPRARLLLRTHPDTRLGRKAGVLARLALPELEVIDVHCHPHALLREVDAVFTVSSQLGFEALLLGKPVHCFGMPFYAGWGLTHDSKQCERRTLTRNAADSVSHVSLPQLVAAALIRYPRYVDPVLQQRCEVEDILDLLARQRQTTPRWETLYLVGFSWWKGAFLRRFCHPLALQLRFVRHPPRRLRGDEQVLVWGSRYPELTSAIRVEDGFIRSRGLGSDLCRPSSLAIDEVGIYFDSRKPSGLEQILNYQPFSTSERARGASLIQLLRQTGVSKYNVTGDERFEPPATTRPRLLVVGQVEGDASLLTGSPVVQRNEDLLWAVRAAHPEAHILYKPHPDVVAGNRSGALSAACMAQCVDTLVSAVPLTELYPHIAALHTMTSLSGFEALIQQVPVVTWGQPFYAGWGLTRDHYPPCRRERTLTLEELVYAALVSYPRYFDWSSGLYASPEQIIQRIAATPSVNYKSHGRWQRWCIKLGYLRETLFGRATSL